MRRIAFKLPSATLMELLVVFVFLLYIQVKWVKSAYEIKVKEIHSNILALLEANNDQFIQKIDQMNSAFINQDINAFRLDNEERAWRSFLDAEFVKNHIALADYDFAIQIQASLTNEPTLFRLKSVNYNKHVSLPGYITIKKIFFSEAKNNIFAYDHQQQTFRVILLYKLNPYWALTQISVILLIVLLVSAISLVAIIIFYLFQKKQQRLEKMKQDFLNGMTHELNTPIAVIQLATEFLKKKHAYPDDFFNHTTNTILQETRRMSNIAKSILATARLQQEKLALNFQPYDLVDLIQHILQTYHFHLYEVDHQINTQFFAPTVNVSIDKFHFHHALSNIIDNAIKYRKKQQKFILEISVQKKHGFLEIIFKDNGMGMNKEELSMAFNRFFRGEESSKKNSMGFGFGLSYVQEVIELHQGVVKLQSTPNSGTIVTILLPAIT